MPPGMPPSGAPPAPALSHGVKDVAKGLRMMRLACHIRNQLDNFHTSSKSLGFMNWVPYSRQEFLTSSPYTLCCLRYLPGPPTSQADKPGMEKHIQAGRAPPWYILLMMGEQMLSSDFSLSSSSSTSACAGRCLSVPFFITSGTTQCFPRHSSMQAQFWSDTYLTVTQLL